MSNRTIFTTVFRASFVNLAKPYANKPTDTPKYSISMMFPKGATGFDGVCSIPKDPEPSNYINIWTALDEVCMEEFGCDFTAATAAGMGINFPPVFKDGDLVFEKDANKQPIAGKINPHSAGMWILSVKNADPVGTADHTGQIAIAASAIYSGSWCSAQLEVSAYTNKDGNRVVVVVLLNVQLCYDDTAIGGRAPVQSATQAFADRAVVNSNVQAGAGQAGTFPPVQQPVAGGVPNLPPVQQPVAGGVPNLPPTQQPVAGATNLPPTQAATNLPPAQAGIPPQAATNLPPTQQPVAGGVPAAAVDPVVMNAGELPYAVCIAAGWTAETLIQNGKATPHPDYLNVPA